MNKLDIIKSMGFKVTWNLIQLGLVEKEEFAAILSRDEVVEFLDSLLKADVVSPIDDITCQTENVIWLICKSEDKESFDRTLNQLAKTEKANIDIQKRKWRAYLLQQILDNTYDSWLQELLEIREFRILIMNEPDDCSHTFPCEIKLDSESEYYTPRMFELVKSESRKWLDSEIKTIIASNE